MSEGERRRAGMGGRWEWDGCVGGRRQEEVGEAGQLGCVAGSYSS